MEARTPLAPRIVCLTSKEKLADRFLVTGSVPAEPKEGPVILYTIEVTRPWFSESKLIPTITSVLQTRYEYIEHSNNPLKSFEAALKNVNDELFSLTEQGETDWLGHVNALIILVDGDEVHVAQTGNATAYLFRQQKMTQVTDEMHTQAEPHPLNTFSNIISGQVAEGDRLVFSNQDLFALASLNQIRAAVIDQTPFVAATQLAKQIRKQKVSSVSAIVVAIETIATWRRAGDEPSIVTLEDALQSWYRAAWKKTKPWLVRAGKATAKGWQHTKDFGAASKKRWQTTYGPKTKAAWQKSAASVSHVASIATDRTKTVLEGVGSRLEKNAPALSVSAYQKTDRWLTQTLAPVVAITYPLQSPLLRVDEAAARFGRWLKPYVTGKNLRYVIITFAVIVLATSMASVRHQRLTQVTVATTAANDTVLTTVEATLARVDSDIKLQQLIEAENLLKEANSQLLTIKIPTSDQSTHRDALAALITTKSDTLSKTSHPTVVATVAVDPKTTVFAASDKGIFSLGFDGNKGAFTTDDHSQTTITYTLNGNTTPLDAAYSPETDETLVLTQNHQLQGLHKDTSAVTVTPRANPMGDYATAKRLAVFNSNVYLLDPDDGLLWKYTRSGDNYNRGISQVDQKDLSLAGAKDLTIDGYIYVLLKDGSVNKLLRGKPDSSFAVKELPRAIDPSTFIAITTADSVDNLFILAATTGGARVVVLDKNGAYLKQYAYTTTIKTPRDITLSAKDKRLWIVGDGTAAAIQL